MRISAAHTDVRVRSAGRQQNANKTKISILHCCGGRACFPPPHLRLQTAAYLPQEGGALIFKQGAKRRAKRFCPSSSLSPRVKSGKGQAAQAPYPQQIHSECACVLLRTDEQANSVSRRARRFWRTRAHMRNGQQGVAAISECAAPCYLCLFQRAEYAWLSCAFFPLTARAGGGKITVKGRARRRTGVI